MFDVNAPNTNWRSGSEDPIPLIFGRSVWAGGLYRFLVCRPLDGTARTDAGFFRAGTKAYTKTGHTLPFNYWPGWKRGLVLTRVPAFGLVPWSAVTAVNEYHEMFGTPYLDWYAPSLAWSPWVAYGTYHLYRYTSQRRFNKAYAYPVRDMAVSVLRTRDSIKVQLDKGLVRGRDESAKGRLYLPPSLSIADGDRDNLLNGVRERLGHAALDGRWNMEGARPYLELYTPAQPPKMVTWEQALERWDAVTPYLGESAAGRVHWDLGQESPHLAVPGGTGSGKSELIAWAMAQFVKGGAGTLVIDPKATSHRWLMNVKGVYYPQGVQGMHDAILWLVGELERRMAENVAAREDIDFPRLAVLIEERNSLQEILREHWKLIKPPGWGAGASPAVSALNRCLSMGRSLNVTILQVSQESAEQKIGSRSNFGSYAIAGRMAENHWRNVGAGKKPPISTTAGRFGYVVGGRVTVFQGAFPDLKKHSDRLREWALDGAPRLDIEELMTQTVNNTSPWSEPMSSGEDTEAHCTLAEYAATTGITITTLRNAKARPRQGESFPESIGLRGTAQLFRGADLDTYFGR